jgi:hypothetical protein
VLSMWSSTVELAEQKFKYAGLAKHNYTACGAW